MLTVQAYAKGLELAKEFYSYTGSLNIGSGLVYKDYNLGEFLRLSIEHYQEGIIPVGVVERLRVLGVDLEKPLPEKESIYYKISEEFLIGYQKAKAYYDTNGDKAIPSFPSLYSLHFTYSLHPTYSSYSSFPSIPSIPPIFPPHLFLLSILSLPIPPLILLPVKSAIYPSENVKNIRLVQKL